MAVITKITTFWDVVPCNLVQIYQCCLGTCCLRFQGDIL